MEYGNDAGPKSAQFERAGRALGEISGRALTATEKVERDAPIRREVERAHAFLEVLAKELSSLRDALQPVSSPQPEKTRTGGVAAVPSGSQIGQSLGAVNVNIDQAICFVREMRLSLEV